MRTVADIVQELTEEATKIYIDKGFLVLDMGHPYEILLSRLDTPEKILGWCLQLSGKKWMNANRMARFTVLAFKQLGVDVDYNM